MNKKYNLEENEKLSDGMKVPPGYFEAFSRSMADRLPANPAAEGNAPVPHRTWWQKSRPYIYMAAMFAGVWCMTQMFSLMKDNSSNSLAGDSVLTAALTNSEFYDDYVISDINEYDILDRMYEQGDQLDDYIFDNE